MRILDYKREREAFCNPVVEWTFAFYVGNRCSGVRGQKGYKSIDAAYDAGEIAIHQEWITGAFSKEA